MTSRYKFVRIDSLDSERTYIAWKWTTSRGSIQLAYVQLCILRKNGSCKHMLVVGTAINLNSVNPPPSANPAPFSQPNKIEPNARATPALRSSSRSMAKFAFVDESNWRRNFDIVYSQLIVSQLHILKLTLILFRPHVNSNWIIYLIPNIEQRKIVALFAAKCESLFWFCFHVTCSFSKRRALFWSHVLFFRMTCQNFNVKNDMSKNQEK